MGFIFDIIAVPLGYVLSFIYNILPNYFVAIFLFTLVVRAATFPLSLKSQKSQAERAKLAPRLERIQKKYAQDRQKMALKQQELYEKEGVSMTGGCLPMIVQMIILFGIISVIYMPLKHLAHMPDTVINASVEAMQNPLMEDGKTEDTSAGKLPRGRFTGYYKELYMMKNLETYKTDVLANIEKVAPGESQKYYDEMIELRSQFDFFGRTLLDNPFEGGFKGINILWLIPLFSGLTALASSIISMHYTKMSMGAQQPGQGCSNTMMLVMMPAFSLFITFTVPGGVGIYWICSNIIAVIQTIILNKIYNPGKIRAQTPSMRSAAARRRRTRSGWPRPGKKRKRIGSRRKRKRPPPRRKPGRMPPPPGRSRWPLPRIPTRSSGARARAVPTTSRRRRLFPGRKRRKSFLQRRLLCKPDRRSRRMRQMSGNRRKKRSRRIERKTK